VNEVRVSRGEKARLSRVDGELRVGREAQIEGLGGLPVVVTGGAYFEGDARLRCDFESGSITSMDGSLRADGDVTVGGKIDVARHVNVAGSIQAKEVDVGGSLRARALSFDWARTGGPVIVIETLRGGSLQAAGKVQVGGAVELESLEFAGKAVVGGGSVRGRMDVKGSLIAEGKLTFGDLAVNGNCSLSAGCKGRSVSMFGRLDSAGDLECESVQLFGKGDIDGCLRAKKVQVDGKLNVANSIQATDGMDAYGSTRALDFAGRTLNVGGGFEASKAIVDGDADLMGQIRTSAGLKAKRITVRRGSTVTGSLVAEAVEIGRSGNVVSSFQKEWMGQLAALRLIGRMTQVEDIDAVEVRLGAYSKARRVSAKRVILEEGSIVASVEYADELKMGSGVHVTHPPYKVDSLRSPQL